MKKLMLLTFINLVLALFQNVFMLELFGPVLNPNLILAFGFSLIALNKKDISVWSVFLGGLFVDMLSSNILGISPLLLIFLVYVAFYVQNYLFRGMHISLIMLFLASITYLVIPTLYFPGLGAVLLHAVFTTIVGIVFYLFNRKYVSSYGLPISRQNTISNYRT